MHHLSALLALLPLALAAPAGNSYCPPPPSQSPVWTLHDLYYHSSEVYTTPAHQNSWGYISFNLSNSALSYVTPCSAQSDQLSDFFYGNMWYTCDTPASAPGGAAYFRYDEPTGRVDVNQTWVDGEATYTASGSGTKTLDCQTDYYKNPNWTTPGTIYQSWTTECQKVDLVITPSQISAVA